MVRIAAESVSLSGAGWPLLAITALVQLTMPRGVEAHVQRPRSIAHDYLWLNFDRDRCDPLGSLEDLADPLLAPGNALLLCPPALVRHRHPGFRLRSPDARRTARPIECAGTCERSISGDLGPSLALMPLRMLLAVRSFKCISVKKTSACSKAAARYPGAMLRAPVLRVETQGRFGFLPDSGRSVCIRVRMPCRWNQ